MKIIDPKSLNIIQGLPPIAQRGDKISFDTEFFNMDKRKLHRPHGDFAFLGCTTNGVDVYYITDQDEIEEFMQRIDAGVWIGHNLKFDITQLRKFAHIPQRKKLWDTMLIDQIMYSGYYDTFSLADVVRRRLDIYLEKDVRATFSENDALSLSESQIEYSCVDVVATWRAYQHQRAEIDENDLEIWKEIELPFLWTIMAMSGVKMDVDKWLALAKRNGDSAKEIQDKYGYWEVDTESKKGKEIFVGINLNSPAQVKAHLATLGHKLKSTDAEALEKLADSCEFAKEMLLYRTYAKRASTYGEKFIQDYVEEDGRIYGDIFQVGACTGRTSSRSPNCYSDDTQVLTERGWVLFQSLKDSDRVAQYNPENKSISFVIPTEHYKSHYDGWMINVKSESLDLLVTPNHRMLSLTRGNAWKVEEASSWYDNWMGTNIIDRKIVRGGYYEKNTFSHILTDKDKTDIELAIAIQAEGCINPKYPNRADIRVKSPRKISQLKRLLPRGKEYSDRFGDTNFRMDNGVSDWLNVSPKYLKIEKFLTLCQSDLEWVLDVIHMWDGDYTRKMTFLQHNDMERMVEFVQTISVLCNKSTSWYEKDGKYSVVNIHRSPIRYASRCEVTAKKYYGYVYCVAVPTSFLVVRRNKDVVISGNTQNLPHDFEYRDCFIAGEGNVMIVADWGSQEPRVAAYLSQDERLIEILNSDKKLYIEIAKDVFHKPVTKQDAEYTHIKSTVLGIFYGMGAQGLAKRIGVSEEEAQNMIDKILETYPGIQDYIEKQRKAGDYVQSIYGRKIWLNKHNNGWLRDALNYPIQSSAADAMKIAAHRFLEELGAIDNPHSPLKLLVHDEIVIECGKPVEKHIKTLLENTMIEVANEMHDGINGSVEIFSGASWGCKS